MLFLVLVFCLLFVTPNVTAVNCDAEPTVTNGGSVNPALPDAPGYAQNVVVTAVCTAGFQSTTDADTAECTAENTWTPESLDCTAITCAALTVTNGVGSSGVTAHSDQITVTCNTGFALSGAATLTCDGTRADDNWDIAPPTCEAFYCDAAPTATNGGSVTPTLPATPGYTGNDVVTASCATGFASTAGANTAECTAADTWTPASLDCTAITCAALTITNGEGSSGVTAHSDQITVTCNTGFALSGAATLTCDGTRADDNWDIAPPTCEAFYCDAAPTATNGGSVTPTLPSTPGYTGNDVVTASCATGFASTAGSNTAECTATNTWTPASLDCTAFTCASAPAAVGGTISGTAPFTGSVTITCDPNLSADPSSASCSATDTWTPDTLTCTAITCAALTVTNGVGSSGVTAHNDQITVTCNAGFAASGAATLTCDGTRPADNWDIAPPTCDAITCAALTVTNGATSTDTTGTTAYNTAVTVTCDPGYQLSSSGSLVCDGTQSSNWNVVVPTCDAITCAALTVTNGVTSPSTAGTTAYNTQVTITCNQGFDISGAAAITCDGTRSDNWSVQPPTCGTTCANAPATTQGTFATGPYSSGQSYSITCNTGYHITSASSTCTNGVWNPTTLTCSDINECSPPAGMPRADNCHANANCTNVVGSFTCQCKTGFTGTGVVCAPGCVKPVIANATFTPDETTYAEGASLTIGCSVGYTSNGTATATCKAASFPTTLTKCTAITCAPLGIANGNGTASVSAYNAQVTVTCNSGYTVSGSANIKCDGTRSEDNWNVAPPTCVGGNAGPRLLTFQTPLMLITLSIMSWFTSQLAFM